MSEGGQGVDVGVTAGVPTPIASLSELFAEQYGAMVRLAWFMTGSNEVAEEVVQAAFLQVHRRWDRIDRPVPYLRTAVVNGCHSHHRRRARERARAEGPAADAVTAETRELLDAVLRLPPRQRAVVVLRFYEDMSEAAIAQTLGCRVGTVKSALHRALASLRQVVEP